MAAATVIHADYIDQSNTQVGFVTSKKVGNAVVRHQVKRRLRHLMRERLGDFPAGARVVVRALPSSAGKTSEELSEDLDNVIGRINRKIEKKFEQSVGMDS